MTGYLGSGRKTSASALAIGGGARTEPGNGRGIPPMGATSSGLICAHSVATAGVSVQESESCTGAAPSAPDRVLRGYYGNRCRITNLVQPGGVTSEKPAALKIAGAPM